MANHNLLDGSVHPDTEAETVNRGSLIVGNTDATPKWHELEITGSANKFLRSDGTDPSWQLIGSGDLPSHNHAATDINSGSLVHERGGLEADVSAFSGLVKISGGATSQVTDNSTNWNNAALAANVFASDNVLVKSDGALTRGVQDSGIIIDDSNNVSNMGTLGCGAINGETIPVVNKARAYQNTQQLNLPDVTWIKVLLDAETFDLNSEFNNTVITVQADGDQVNHLIDSDKNFPVLGVQVGWWVWNTDANLYAKVTAVADGDLTLSSDAFPNGNENGKVYASRFTPKTAGYYQVNGMLQFANIIANKTYVAAIYKNGSVVSSNYSQSGSATYGGQSVPVSDLIYLNGTTDYLELYSFINTGVATVDVYNGSPYTYLAIERII